MDSETIDFSSSELNQVAEPELLDEFPIVDEDMSYEEFYRTFLVQNVPCLISDKRLTQNWRSLADWASEDGKKCQIDFFQNILAPNLKVPVADCDSKYFNSQEKLEMTLEDYLNYWHRRQGDTTEKRCLYLKDWHFRRDCPNYTAYRTPKYFSSDWLNEFWDERKKAYVGGGPQDDNINVDDDDYKFVYVGPANSWTPFHSDVFGSFSWSANVVGTKRWIFVHPGHEKVLSRVNSDELIYDVRDAIPTCEACDRHLKAVHLPDGKVLRYFEILQRRGEVIFVPSGWHHQVENLEDTISINHNWFNASNVRFIWKNLESAFRSVEKEISDCKVGSTDEEFSKMCQTLLRANNGMNFEDFFRLLNIVAAKRIKFLTSVSTNDVTGQTSNVVFDGWMLGRHHASYDLKRIHDQLKVLQAMKESSFLLDKVETLMNEISFVLDNK